MKRPGEKDERGAGCCLFFLGMPFVVAGILGAIGFSSQKSGGSSSVLFFTLLFPAVFACVGGAMIYGGLRCMRAGGRLSQPLPAAAAGGGWRESPWFPRLRKRSVTARGRVRLPYQQSPGLNFLVLLVVTIFWNTASWGAAYGVIRQTATQSAPVSLGSAIMAVLFFGVFCLIGLLMIFAVLKDLASWVLVGSTWIELAGEPVTPGSPVSATLHQNGDFEVSRLTVSLLCAEEAEHGSGKQRKTSREVVHREVLLERRNLRARNGQAMAQWELLIPPGATHSFKAPANRIRWTLEVKMDIPGRPDVDATFEFRVGPGGGH